MGTRSASQLLLRDMQFKLASSAVLLKLFILNLGLVALVSWYTTYVAVTDQFGVMNLLLVGCSWCLVLIQSFLTVSHTATNLNIYKHLLDVLWEKEGILEGERNSVSVDRT